MKNTSNNSKMKRQWDGNRLCNTHENMANSIRKVSAPKNISDSRLHRTRKRRRRLAIRIRIGFILLLWAASFTTGFLHTIKHNANETFSENTTLIGKPHGQSQNKTPIKRINKPLSELTIVVDAGHGGKDSGAIGGFSRVCESDINLNISYALADELKSLGAKVVMTRTKEITVKLGNSQKLSLEQRQAVVEASNADLFLSIYQNSNEDSAIRGTQILVRKSEDLEFAQELQSAYNEELSTNLHCIQDDFIVLSYGNQPSFIVECGFLSNRNEEEMVQNTEYQQRLVKVLLNKVVEYWGQT